MSYARMVFDEIPDPKLMLSQGKFLFPLCDTAPKIRKG